MKYAHTQQQLFFLQMCVQTPKQIGCFPSISGILSGKDPKWMDIPEGKKINIMSFAFIIPNESLLQGINYIKVMTGNNYV